MDTPEPLPIPPPAPEITGAQPTAEPGLRLLGYLLDVVPLIVLGLIPYLGRVLVIIYLLLRDGIVPGQGFGKKIMNTQVVVEKTGLPATFAESALRNSPLVVGSILTFLPGVLAYLGIAVGLIVAIVELVLIFTDPKRQRFGDKLAGTIVVKKRVPALPVA